MRPTGVVIALALLCACGKGDDGKPKPAAAPEAPAPPPAPRHADAKVLLEGVKAASLSDDPGGAIVKLAATSCGRGCPCIDPAHAGDGECKLARIGQAAIGAPVPLAWAGKYLADEAATMTPAEQGELASALTALRISGPPNAAGLTLPPGKSVVPASSWAVLRIARDGAFAVGRTSRVELTATGPVFVAGVEPRPTPDDFDVAIRELQPPTPELPPGALGGLTGDIADDEPSLTDVVYPDDPCGGEGFGFGRTGFGPGGGAKDGWGTIGTGRYGTIGHGGGKQPRFAVRLIKGAAHDGVLVVADAAAPSLRVLQALQAVAWRSGALAVQAGSGVSALDLILCYSAGDQGKVIKLEGGADPQGVRAEFEAAKAKDGVTILTLLVSDNATHGDLVGALDALLEAGATSISLRSAATAATGRIRNIPSTRVGMPTVVGDLDKAIIRRYIKRNLSKITYCYEKVLLARPTIEGTVTTQFFVSPAGEVVSAKADGVDPEVSSCLVDLLRSIEFPKPKGGGGVQVTFPFTFAPTGG